MKTNFNTSLARLPLLAATSALACAILLARPASAQTFNQIKSFLPIALDSSIGTYTNDGGAYPKGRLSLAGGTLYGTANGAGSGGNGTVFKINTDGSSFAVLRNLSVGAIDSATGQFTNSDGQQPQSKLLVSGGTVYGTAAYGGGLANGTLFKMSTNGDGFTVLRTFANGASDGANPHGNLVLTGAGFLFGTTQLGGNGGGGGIIFKVDTNGNNFSIIHHFSFAQTNGAFPLAGLLLVNGTFYGTTYAGGASGWGTVFKLDTSGNSFTLLKSFPSPNPPDFTGTNSDGSHPTAQLELSDGRLYGTTQYGGASSNGVVFAINTNGTGFTVLHHFSATLPAGFGIVTNTDGANPSGRLVFFGGKLYGTTQYGGEGGSGTIFQINTNGSGFSVINAFAQINGFGGVPAAGLLMSGGTFYGTTQYGGEGAAGTIFSLAVPGPQLTITPAGANVILSWPADDIGFTLESTPNLGVSALWNMVSPAPIIISNRNTVTNPISGEARFYRLMQ